MRLRRGSGSREEDLLARAKELRKSVDPLLPQCAAGVDPDSFGKLREKLEEVRADREDAKLLERHARWGEPLARAYAGLLRFYLEPSPPTLLSVRDGANEIHFAPLARVEPELQIAVQGFNDPIRLLFGYRTFAKKGWHFFATPSGLVTTGRDPAPPRGYLEARERDLPYRFTSGPHGTRRCAHLAQGEPGAYLEVDWPRAGASWRLCRRCTREDAHLFVGLTSACAVPRLEDAVAVNASLGVSCSDRNCPHQDLTGPSSRLERAYREGRRDDKEFLREFEREAQDRLRPRGRVLLVAQGICYGENAKAFTEALHPTRPERAALERVLPQLDGVFDLPDATASIALERLWKDHAEEIIAAIEPDERQAAQWATEARQTPGRVSDLLRRAAQRVEERERGSAFPRYRRLAPEARLVDAVVRAQRIAGVEAAEKRLFTDLPREGKERGLAWAILLGMDRATPHAWQFTDTEQRFGAGLRESARALLTAEPSAYHGALGRLMSSAGVADWGELEPSAPAADSAVPVPR